MTVIENLSPRVQYIYTNGNQSYPITFPYIEREYVKVMVRDQTLTYNRHYTVPSFNAASLAAEQLNITLLITPTSDLHDGITIANGDTITIYRSTAFDQQQEFPQTAKFSSQKITEALDKLTHQQQEQEDDLQQCFRLAKNIPVGFNTELPYPVAKQVLQWNEDGTQLINYDLRDEIADITAVAEAATEEAMGYRDAAKEQADRAAQYADSAEFGMKWIGFTIANWIAISDKYKLTLSNVPIVNSVFKGTWSAKELVANIDIKVTDTGCEITSLEAFDGYVLTSSSILGTYEYEQTLASDEWIIDHNTGHYPCVTLVDDNNIVMLGTIQYVTLNRIKVTFTEPVTGKAYLR